MFKLIQRLKYKLPNRIKDVWYNVAVHSSKTDYPVVFDENNKYIDCKVGLKVKMYKLKNGKFAYYEVVKIRRAHNSDWLYDSDRNNCDLRFSHVSF